MNRPVCGLGAFRMDLDLAQTEDAHPLSPSSPAAGSDETKETSLGSQVSSTSLEDTEDVGNEKQEGEKEKDEEEEEVEEEDVEGGSNREKRAEDIFASSTGPAGPDTVETCHASKNTIQKQKKKKKKGGKSRKKREAQRRYGPPHLDRETIKRAKVSMRIIAFFYHLSLSVLVATWTELLLKGFDNNFSKAAAFLGTCQGVERGIQFLTAASLGNLSDCVGRRPVLFASLVLNIISTLCVIVKPGPMTVLAYFIISGLSNCILAMLNAIVGDLAAGREELEGGLTQQYGRLGMAIGLAMMVGPMLGPSIQQFNVVYPLYISITLVIICVLICLSMAESLPPQNRHMKLEHSNPLWGLKKAMRYRPFLLFALPFFLSQLSESVYAFIVIYTKQRLGWSYVSVGLYISLLALTIAILQGNLRHIVPRFVSDKGCVLIGLCMHGVSMAIIGSAFASWMMFVMMLPRLLAGLKLPGILAFMTQGVVHGDQGIVQGSIMSLRVLARAIGTPLFGVVFGHFFDKHRIARQGDWISGITFYLAGAFDVLSAAAAIWVFYVLLKDGKDEGTRAKSGQRSIELMEEGREEATA